MSSITAPPFAPARRFRVQAGNPDPSHISTSYVERQNLTMRMGMRRFTRLTNGFSKKVENLAHSVSLHFAYYNFCRAHESLTVEAVGGSRATVARTRRTPAMAAGIATTQWSLTPARGLAGLIGESNVSYYRPQDGRFGQRSPRGPS